MRSFGARAMQLLAIAVFVVARASAQSLPPDFMIEPIGSGWANPVGFAFVDGTSLLVAEKNGKLWFFDGTTRSLALDLRGEVLNKGDRGLLDVAVDPQFASNGWVYLLLTADPNADNLDEEQEAFARLVRFTATAAPGSFTIDPASRVDLLGATWPDGVPSCALSHTIGTLAFLSDGSLLAGAGDGAHWEFLDVGGNDPGCFGSGRFPNEQDLGAFRAQMLGSLSGKILRVDPSTGLGLPDNPFFDGDATSIVSRVWALGLRNPFRFALKPGSGGREAVYVSDVGWSTWEEIDVVRGGENLGWPCAEGPVANADYRAADTQGFCSSATLVDPILAWNHSDPGSLGFTGTCVSGVCVYARGTYPPLYHGALFFADFSAGWLKLALLDDSDHVVSVLPFADGLGRPITLRTDPFSGDLVYVDLATAQILRLRYVGENLPPVPVVSADPTVGLAPLSVQFRAADSYDPEGGPLSYLWSFGDGTTSTEADPVHVYADDGQFAASVMLTDVQGQAVSAELTILVGNTPPVIKSIDAPLDGSFYQSGVPVVLSATASDLEDDADHKPLDAVWHVNLVHSHDTRPDWLTVDGLNGSFLPESEALSAFLYLTLVVTDSAGASASRSISIYDVDTAPVAHLVVLSDPVPRVAQPVTGTGHLEYPGKGPADLIWDWSDGAIDTFHDVVHQADTHPTHRYATPGIYQVALTASNGADQHTVTQSVNVRSASSAVAVFVPLVAERFIPWSEQEAIANEVVAAVRAEGFDADVFYYSDQAALEQWVRALMDDQVQDAIVLLDLCPATLFAGERDASLAERWIEAGDGIVWTGAQPFAEFLFSDGTTGSATGASGADLVLDVLAPGICEGSGAQQPTPLAARELPSLTAFTSAFAMRTAQLGTAWRVDRVYADGSPQETDAVVITHRRGGFFAQLLCTPDAGVPRASALIELLQASVLHARPRVPVGGGEPVRSNGTPGR